MAETGPKIGGAAVGFPLVRVASADARARGRMIGAAAKSRVAESVAAYQETFDHYTGLGWDEVKALALEFAPAIADYDAALLEEIEGIAEGAELTLGDLLAVNARSEIMFGLEILPPPECTAFFAGPSATADGNVLLGQNWDWRPRAIESTTLIEVDQGGRLPSFVMLPEAGLIGKTGFNEYGIGVTLNALVSDRDVGERLVPVHVILRGILNSRTVEEALAAVVRARRAASANYTIASATGVGVAAEVGPGGIETVNLIKPTDGILAHTNHFACPTSLRDVMAEKVPDSFHRLETMQGFLARHRGTITAETIKQVLCDSQGHPNAICRRPDPQEHPVEQAETVASLVMDLSAGSVEIAAGPPEQAAYSTFVPNFSNNSKGEH